jgi:hypothetical protein
MRMGSDAGLLNDSAVQCSALQYIAVQYSAVLGSRRHLLDAGLLNYRIAHLVNYTENMPT